MMVLQLQPTYRGTRSGFADEDYLASQRCIACHPAHHASWARTHHSRMTQTALPTTVQGDFERENTFDYLGVRARMERRDGQFSMSFTFPDGRAQTFPIARTVGSRRIEQYLTKQGNGYLRLPLAYDLTNRRWMSLNGSFFYPDGDNFFQHQTQWDPNCVFCHNVKAQPHRDASTGQFKTEVAELGIACGSCHGAAAAHAEAAASPLTRTLWRLADEGDKKIVNPEKLDTDLALMVCGHCHGQRIPQPIDRIQEIMTRGDPYHAGDDLSRYYQPVWRETKVGDYSFANRFWANGSPRLTAYEYQGLLRSKCFQAGEAGKRINCLSCHAMHEGDVKGQLTEAKRTDAACLACHRQYEDREALSAHSQHRFDSTGSRCYNCHMPRVIYGVMAIHPAHDITVPDPQLTANAAVPNACNQCHLDQSVNWAIRAAKRLWPARFAAAQPSADPQFDVAEAPRALFAGDALTRALAAEALSGGDTALVDADWARPFLVEAFADNYPVVRFFAANGLRAGLERTGMKAKTNIPDLDYLATAEARQMSLAAWRELFDPTTRQRVKQFAERLRAGRKEVDIEVGE